MTTGSESLTRPAPTNPQFDDAPCDASHGALLELMAGIAGSLEGSTVDSGDVVIVSASLQHDLGSMTEAHITPWTPWTPTGVPLGATFDSSPELVDAMYRALHGVSLEPWTLAPPCVCADPSAPQPCPGPPRRVGCDQPRACAGIAATGDVFLADPMAAATIAQRSHSVIVDMETAAVAQRSQQPRRAARRHPRDGGRCRERGRSALRVPDPLHREAIARGCMRGSPRIDRAAEGAGAPRDAMRARLHGRQQSVLVADLRDRVEGRNGYVIVDLGPGGTLHPNRAGAFYAHAARVEPRVGCGFTAMNDDMLFINMTSGADRMTDAEFEAALRRAAVSFEPFAQVLETGIADARFINDNWADHPDGQGYEAKLAATYRAALREASALHSRSPRLAAVRRTSTASPASVWKRRRGRWASAGCASRASPRIPSCEASRRSRRSSASCCVSWRSRRRRT